jgi:dihydroxyacid dehydratase/phosphogluconate dehydratase
MITIRILLARRPGILHTDVLTTTGRTLGENVYGVELARYATMATSASAGAVLRL